MEDFPLLGEMVRLEWQQNKQNFVITSGTRPAGANRAGVAGMGYLENPGAELLSERYRGDLGLGV